LSELTATNTVIVTLQDLVHNMASTPRRRRALIGLEPFCVTLSETVLIFAELDTLIAPFKKISEISWWSRIRWIRSEGNITRAIERLQSHKISMLLILNILQWYDLRHVCASFD
jgi:hypothetical protein